MEDVMIDIETLGTSVGCPILSVGAVEFCRHTGEFGRECEWVVNFSEAVNSGKVDGNTLSWWMLQSDEARQALFNEFSVTPVQALQGLSNFVKDYQKVWGNGSTFDISILEYAMKQNDIHIPWKFWNVRDVRTVVDLASGICNKKGFENNRVAAHTALGDAKHQAEYVSSMIINLRSR